MSEVEGWLTDAQAARLRARAAAVVSGDAGLVVEIGSFRGKSTIAMASVGAEVVAIDPHLGSDRGPREIAADAERGDADFDVFHANLRAAGVSGRVTHVRKRSEDAVGDVPDGIPVLYIDGAHRFGPALADIRDFGAKVAPGGTMLVHDAFSSIGVTLALVRSVVFSRSWSYVGRDGSLAEWRRAPGGWRSSARALSSLPFFARNVVLKVLIVAGLRSGPWPY